MDPGKRAALLAFINSTGTCIEDLTHLCDGVQIVKVIKYMQGSEDRPEAEGSSKEDNCWTYVKEFLKGSNHPYLISSIDWDTVSNGNDAEIAKVIVLLLSMSITCPNKDTLMNVMTSFEYESQVHIRHILSETLTPKHPSQLGNFFDILSKKAPTLVEQQDLDLSASPVRNSLTMGSSVNSINMSPCSQHNMSLQSASRSIYNTPVRLFNPLEEEEVYFSVPASCPPLRRGSSQRPNFSKFETFNNSSECSPMREFLASPVINYKIKIRDLDQKICILEKNLNQERLAKEECEKQAIEREEKCQDLEQKVRKLSRRTVDTKQLFDEIDELHEIRTERDSLQKENLKLKHQLDKNDTYRNESKDLKRDLDSQIKENEELSKQIKTLKNSLASAIEDTQETTEYEETCKSLQERNAVLEDEISQLYSDMHKLKTQNIELKELYESKITDLKAVLDEKDSSCVSVEGESMGVFLEHRMLELQETMKEMEETWLKPDATTRLRADLDTAKETMKQFDVKVHSLGSEKIVLEEELCSSQQELMKKSAEIMDLLKNVAATNQRIKNSESAAEAMRARLNSLTNDKEHQKCRIKDLENELLESTQSMSKLQVELNMTKSENDSKAHAMESQVRRLSVSNQMIADYEQQIRAREQEISNVNMKLQDSEMKIQGMTQDVENMTEMHRDQISVLEKKYDSLKMKAEKYEAESQSLSEKLDANERMLTSVRESLEEEKRMNECERDDERKKSLKLEEIVVDLNKKLFLMKKESADFQEEIGNLQKETEKSRSDRSNLEKKIESLQQEHDSTMKKKEDEFLDLQKLMDAEKEAKSGIETELKSFRKQMDEEVTSLRQEKSSLKDDLDSQIKELTSRMKKEEDEKMLVQDALDGEKNGRRFLEVKYKSLNEDLLSKIKDLQDNQEELDNWKKDAENSSEDLAKLEQQMEKIKEDSDTKLKTLEKEVQRLVQENDVQAKNLTKHEEKFASLQEKYDDKVHELEIRSEELKKIQIELQDVEELKIKKEDELMSVSNELKLKRKENESLASEMKEMEENCIQKEKDVQGLKETSSEDLAKLEQQMKKIKEDSDTKLMNLEKEVQHFVQENEVQAENLIKYKEELDSIQEKYDVKVHEFEMQEEELNKIQIELQDVEELKIKKEDDLMSVSNELELKQKENESLASELKEMKENCIQKERDIQGLKETSSEDLAKFEQQMEKIKEDSDTKLTNLEKEVQQLVQENGVHADNITKHKKELASIQEKCDVKVNELEMREEELNKIQIELQDLEEMKIKKEDELMSVSNELELKQKENESLSSEMKEMEENCILKEKEIQELKETIQKEQRKSKEVVESYEKEISQLQTSYEDSNAALEKQTSNSSALLSELSTQRQELMRMLEEKEQEARDSHDQLRSETKRRESCEEEIQLHKERSLAKCKLMEEKITRLEDSSSSLGSSELSLRKELEVAESRLEKEEEKMSSLEADVRRAEEEISSLQARGEELNEKLKLKAEEVLASQMKMSDQDTVIQNHMDEISSMKESLASVKFLLEEKKNQMSSMKNQMDVDEEVRQETLNDLINVKAEVEFCEKSHKEEINILNGNVATLKQELNDSQQKYSASEEELKDDLRRKKNLISELSSKSLDDENKILLCQQENAELSNSIQQKDVLLTESTGKLEDLRIQLADQEKVLEASSEKVSSLKDLLKEMEDASSQMKSELQTSRGASEKNMEVMTSQLSDERSQLHEANETILSLNRDILSSNEKMAASIKELADVRNELDELRSQSNCEKEKVEEEKILNEAKILEYKEKISDYNEKLERATSENETLKKKMEDMLETHEEELKELKSQMEQNAQLLEEKIQKLLKTDIENQSTQESLRLENAEIKELLEMKEQEKQEIKKENLGHNQDKETLSSELNSTKQLMLKMQNEVLDLTEQNEVSNLKIIELESVHLNGNEQLEDMREKLDKALHDLSETQKLADTLQDEKVHGEMKLEAIRAQFTEKYRSKQEKIQAVEKDLKDWQERADGQTAKYDNMALMYNEKSRQLHKTVNELDQLQDENMELNKINQNLKLKNDVLTSSSSQMNFKKIEEEKKIKQLDGEVRTLKTQLQFAERRIRELQLDADSRMRNRSSVYSQVLPSQTEDFATSRRHSLSGDDGGFSEDNLFRCRSDTFLDSPTIANKKVPHDERNEVLDDSLDDILRTPVNMQTEKPGHKAYAALNHSSIHSPDNRRAITRSHISIESSLLSESPSGQNSRYRSQSHQQLHTSNLDTSRISQESADVNMNSSNLAEVSFAADGSWNQNRIAAHSKLGFCRRLSVDNEKELWREISVIQSARHTPGFSLQTFQTEEEPEDYEWGSLRRLAELQRRNAATLPHLKSSYPVETQGQTPSKCDETVRIGDADGTMQRLSNTSLMQSSVLDQSRRTTMDFNSSTSRHSTQLGSNSSQQPKRKLLRQEPSTSQKNHRESIAANGRQEDTWANSIPENPIENIDPRRQSLMFEIPNSPHKRNLRSRASKRSTSKQESKSDAATGPSNSKVNALMKTPDKSLRSSKRIDEKRRTPSLMDRVRKPLGRFNSKK